MRKSVFPLFIILLTPFTSCKKDNSLLVTGTVIEKKGCFPDSWLIAISNPDLSKHPFLRAPVLDCAACYNCGNAVYISLSPGLASPGTKIGFVYSATIASCLSYSEAPEHIEVKDLTKF